MTDVRVAFLGRLASSISNTDKSNTLLKSFYLMRCRELVNDTGLLQKYFPIERTCSYCGIKWSKGECIINIKPKKITKSQNRRTKISKEVKKNKKTLKIKKAAVVYNQLEKVCQLCKHSTFINLVKPNIAENKKTRKDNMSELTRGSNDINTKTNNVQTNENNKTAKKEINVYSSTRDVFSLLNKNNSIVPNKSKVVKSSKRKKDKFAGLCKEAVLSMANMKKEKNPIAVNNKLNLFLKPSK